MRKIANHELGRPTADEYASRPKRPVVVVLENIRSLHNIGSFFRTADAFAIERIILCGISATPPSKEIHKTALGAELSVAWEYVASAPEAIERLAAEGYQTWAVEQVEGAALLGEHRFDPAARYALVFGNEVEGVSQAAVDACQRALEIPQQGTKHSLNVAVAGGAVLWEVARQLPLE